MTTPAQNPLLAPWTGPYGGVPPFALVQVADFLPAFEAAMAEKLAQIERIADDPAPPTFENTLAALERAGRTLDRVRSLYEIWSSVLATPEFQAVEREMAPRLAAFDDRIQQNARLFARIETVYESRASSCATPEQARLAWLLHARFVRSGARLEPPAKERVAAINERLAVLETTFAQNLLGDEDAYPLFLSREDLAGLPDEVSAAMAAAARESGHPGKWVVLNTRSSVEPFLTFSSRRDLREQVWHAFVERGDHAGPRDNKPLLREILRLRAERARLLGYPTHAHYRLEDQMAKTPERALSLMGAVWPAAVARVHEEVAEMQALADREAAGIRIEPWDYRYYAEKVRKARFDVDENVLKPYLQLERLREAMFFVAGRLFDLHFQPARGVPVYHPDVRVFEVKDGAGRLVGLWYLDPFARPGKRSGAWMEAYRDQESFDGAVLPIVSNNANFVKGAPGEPVLLSWDDASTLFHEFGHALHGLLSRVSYPSLSGTEVPRDYVEFPSQLLERWLFTSEVLERFALHARTGEPMPKELIARIRRAATFNQGFAMVEYLSAALLDMKMHLVGGEVDPSAFERETLAELGMPREMVMRHRLPQFAHVFASDGYSAGYYSYLWAETLSADAFAAFAEAGDPFAPALAAKLRQRVFSVGNTVDPAEAYRAFRGRDPGVEALMRWRGFPLPHGGAHG
ncbi:MAG TPA: M3 family metallopeptidase [Anaeromyxobacter sp.]|nr:M3 family metallopeptidase [Anaeromyxobacter sp.]